jgi:acetyl esterase
MKDSQMNAIKNTTKRKLPMRKKLVGKVLNFFFKTASSTGKYLLGYHKRLAKLKLIKNVAYGPIVPDHLLDIYMKPEHYDALQNPETKATIKLKPAIFYVHGGGFVILSKDTHWSLALKFAEQDFVVFNINYRLAPTHACPAALEDSVNALLWVLDHAKEYGVDPDQIYLAGESAGGHLVTAITLCTLSAKPSSWAQRLFQYQNTKGQPWQPKAVLPACGLLQVSHPERLQGQTNPLLFDRIDYICYSYGGQSEEPHWADPLLDFESDQVFDRPIPPFLIVVGTHDPVMEDSARLNIALRKRNVDCEYKVYEGGVHAFHAFIWFKIADACWEDHFNFLKRLS